VIKGSQESWSVCFFAFAAKRRVFTAFLPMENRESG
jgi:hypothetical protein